MLFLWTLWADLFGGEYQLPQPFSARTSASSSPKNSLSPRPGKTQRAVASAGLCQSEAQVIVHMKHHLLLPTFVFFFKDPESFGMKDQFVKEKLFFFIFCKIFSLSKFLLKGLVFLLYPQSNSFASSKDICPCSIIIHIATMCA